MTTGFDFEFTADQLSEILSGNPYSEIWHEVLTRILPDYGIDTKIRLAAFLAQCAHESANFTAVKENLNYRWESLRRVFPKYFPNDALAKQYARQPEKIANRVYANRMGNGPEASGDGWKYRGRGLIQLTGKNNYQLFASSIDIDVQEALEFMDTFEGCVQSACWFWETNNLNKWVDSGDFDGLSDSINMGRKTAKEGDSIGYADRLKHFAHARKVLGI